MQNSEQIGQPSGKRGNPNWGRRDLGNTASGNPAGKASFGRRRAALLRDLIADLGGVDRLSATDLVLVGKAADLLARNPADDLHRTRNVNTADRVLRMVRKRLGFDRGRGRAPTAPAPSLDDLLARRA